MTTTPEKRNPFCDIPGCDCQNGPPVERCAECGAASPHHFDACSHYERPLPKSEALLTARPPASGPTPTPVIAATEDHPAIYRDGHRLTATPPLHPSSSLGAATAAAIRCKPCGDTGYETGVFPVPCKWCGGSPTGEPGEEQPPEQLHAEKTENFQPQGLVPSREADVRETIITVKDTKYPPLYLRLTPDGAPQYSYAYPGPLWHDIAEALEKRNEAILADAAAIGEAMWLAGCRP